MLHYGEELTHHLERVERTTRRAAEGNILLQVRQVREWASDGLYRSELIQRLRGSSDVLNGLAVEMHAHSLSGRDVEDALWGTMERLLLSRNAVSELSRT